MWLFLPPCGHRSSAESSTLRATTCDRTTCAGGPPDGIRAATSGGGVIDGGLVPSLDRERAEMLFVSDLEVREAVRVALPAEMFERVGRRDAAKLG